MTGRWRQPALPALLGAVAVAVQLLGLGPALRYDRAAIEAGQWWRLLTGHLPHLGPAHLLLNLAGLALAWALVGRNLTPRGWAAGLPLLALGTTLGLYAFVPSLGWYVGLSGLLHGVLVLGALLDRDRREGALLLALVTAKLVWEAWHGPVGSWVGPVVIEAHRYGALSALLVAPLMLPLRPPTPDDHRRQRST